MEDLSELFPKVWVTWHPAYVLRSPAARATVVSDLRRVRDTRTSAAEIPWRYDDTTVIRVGEAVAYDIETYDEEGKILDVPTQIAYAREGDVVVSPDPIDVPSMIQEIAGKASSSQFPVGGHNVWEFDDRLTGIASHWDTRAMFYLIDENQPLNLESLAVKYLGVRGWKESEHSRLYTNEMAEYNARDAMMTLRLYHKGRELLGDRMRLHDIILRPARSALDDITRRGVWINAETVLSHKATNEVERTERLAAVMRELKACGFPDDAFDVQLKTKVRKVPFNPNSNDHVGKVLGEHLGFRLPMTKQGKPAVGKDELVYIDHPFAKAVLAYREVEKQRSTYIDPYLEIATTGDGRAHPTYKLTSVVTGRTSASKPNTQNLDRSLQNMKDAAPGRVLTSADYAAVEFRMGAFIADEEVIISRLSESGSWDPHTWFALRLYGEEAIREASMLAMQACIPTDRAGAEILRALLSHSREGKQTGTLLEDLSRAGWSRDGKLPAQEGRRASLLSRRDEYLSALSEGQVRTLREYAQSRRSSQGSQSAEQSPFQFDDAMQALSSAAPYLTSFAEWKERRQIAKSANFSLEYDGTGETIRAYAAREMGIFLDSETAERTHRAWHRAFPGWKPWYDRVWAEYAEKGYVEDPVGFRRHYGDVSLLNRQGRIDARRELSNALVQGFCARIAQLALGAAHASGLPMVDFVHDDIKFEFASEEEAVAAEAEIQRRMVDEPLRVLREVWGVVPTVPLAIEIKHKRHGEEKAFRTTMYNIHR